MDHFGEPQILPQKWFLEFYECTLNHAHGHIVRMLMHKKLSISSAVYGGKLLNLFKLQSSAGTKSIFISWDSPLTFLLIGNGFSSHTRGGGIFRLKTFSENAIWKYYWRERVGCV
jgi:hypothetical protein